MKLQLRFFGKYKAALLILGIAAGIGVLIFTWAQGRFPRSFLTMTELVEGLASDHVSI